MSIGQLRKIKRRHAVTRAADAQLASHLPELGLPCMNDGARMAFRAILDYETPFGNGSLRDFLMLAEARGFCAHPMDWIPAPDDAQYSPLYQPWVDWMSDNGVTEFHAGNRLTKDNWARWKPKARLAAFKRRMREDVQAAHDLLATVGTTQPATTRLALLNEINAFAAFSGNYPYQVPLLKHFLADRSANIRAVAETKLRAMNGLETEAAHAAVLATQITASGGAVTYATPPAAHTQPYFKNFACTTFDLLAKALGLSPQQLARQSDLKALGSDFMLLVVLTGDVETRSIVASRLLEMGETDLASGLFDGVTRPLWEQGLRATFKSHFWFSVAEFLGLEAGTLTPTRMRELACYEHWETSVTNEIESGKLPVNGQYDPLRVLGLVVDKDAAQAIIDLAVALGMKETHPRLTMLKFNLAL
ncbi:hypothetical protein HL667_03105 [Bradyrhizobium sp. 83012]|uniref:Uncharacterized protein n=1 Tax=Bradyrhizobium aeschynomenes TaxID=2734909 RepID=A0ABX2C6S1_9BRAD|nr:DUF5691 domain-containing protein [Bradyrhizobium aeschynomenes]NPU63979.1 hypothetical protein [Bradyrhizobium aeschynomenes]